MPPPLLLRPQEADPLIAGAIRYGALLENVVFGEEGRQVDFDSAGITENTRAAYPIEHIGALCGLCGVGEGRCCGGV